MAWLARNLRLTFLMACASSVVCGLPAIRLGICGYFPATTRMYQLMDFAAKVAFEEGFFDNQLRNNSFTIDIEAIDTRCSSSVAAELSLPLILGEGMEAGRMYSNTTSKAPVVAFSGCGCSGSSAMVSELGNPFKMPVVSGAATSPSLSNKERYPFFSRVIPTDDNQGFGFARLIAYYGWQRVVLVYPGTSYAEGIVSAFLDSMASRDPGVAIFRELVPQMPLQSADDAAAYNYSLVNSVAFTARTLRPQPRIFLLPANGQDVGPIIRAFEENGLAGPNAMWFLAESGCAMTALLHVAAKQPEWLAEWSNASMPANPAFADTAVSYDWTALPEAVLGLMCLLPVAKGPLYHSAKFDQFWTNLTRNKLLAAGMPEAHYSEPSFFADFTHLDTKIYYPLIFDSMSSLIVAIGNMLADGIAPEDIRGESLLTAVRGVSFEGLSGNISFDLKGDRMAGYRISNLQRTASSIEFVDVGFFDGSSDALSFDQDPIFGDGGTVPPADRPAPCDAGSSFTDMGCVACPSGKFGPAVDSACFDCAVGTFSASTGLTACTLASPGSYVPTAAALASLLCDAGTFSALLGAIECRTCPSGTFGASTGLSECTPAATGSYVPSAGATASLLCDAGTISAMEGASECENCVAGTFGASAGMSECTPAPNGSYVPSAGATASLLCDAGTISALPGAIRCETCTEGTAQPQTGQNKCDRCTIGRYSSATRTECTPCSGQMTTQYPASTTGSDCGCAKDTYKDGDECRACPEGMTCAFGVSANSFSAADGSSPVLLPSFYSTVEEPLSVYRCGEDASEACPGGAPGMCGQGREGLVCTKCKDGQYFDGGMCSDCSAIGTVGLVLAFIGLIGVATVIYYISNSPLTSNASVSLALTLTFGIIVTNVQVLGTLGQLEVRWPGASRSVMDASQIFLFDPDAVTVECLLGHDVTSLFLLRFLVPFFILGIYALLFLLFSMLGKVKASMSWSALRTLNSIGTLYQVIFIAITGIATTPFQCYSHPNGKRSVVMYPDVICGSDDHTPVLVMGILLIVLFVIPFMGLNCFVVSQAHTNDRRYISSKTMFVVFRYLLYRFRPDVWWWGVVFCIRQMLLAFAPALEPDDPSAQVVYVASVMVLYLALLCFFWPWKSHELNILDAVSACMLALCVVAAGSFLPPSQWEPSHTALLGFFLVMLGVGGIVLLSCIFYKILTKGAGADFGLPYLHYSKDAVRQLAVDLRAVSSNIAGLTDEDVARLMQNMNPYDHRSLSQMLTATSIASRGSFKIAKSSSSARLTVLSKNATDKDFAVRNTKPVNVYLI